MTASRGLFTLVLCCASSGCTLFTDHRLHIATAQNPKIILGQASDEWPKPSWGSRAYLVAIDLETDRDLSNFAQANEYNVANEISLCNPDGFDESRGLQNDPYLFTKNGEWNSLSLGQTEIGRNFRVYFSLSRFPTASDTEKTFRYDLRSNPADICIKLMGGNMLGGHFVSNTAVVSKASLIDAISKAGL